MGFCHIKAVDDCGHDRNLALRIAWIERVDAFLKQVGGRIGSLAPKTTHGQHQTQ